MVDLMRICGYSRAHTAKYGGSPCYLHNDFRCALPSPSAVSTAPGVPSTPWGPAPHGPTRRLHGLFRSVFRQPASPP